MAGTMSSRTYISFRWIAPLDIDKRNNAVLHHLAVTWLVILTDMSRRSIIKDNRSYQYIHLFPPPCPRRYLTSSVAQKQESMMMESYQKYPTQWDCHGIIQRLKSLGSLNSCDIVNWRTYQLYTVYCICICIGIALICIILYQTVINIYDFLITCIEFYHSQYCKVIIIIIYLSINICT